MNKSLLTALILSCLLGTLPPARAAAKPPLAAPVTAPDVPDAKLRGTVTAVDFRRGAFTLRVNDHPWTVFVTPDTDASALGPSAADRFAVTLGERVSVGGPVQPDGTVLAVLLTQSRDIAYAPAPDRPDRILFGRISSRSGRLRGRDIKIRSADGVETKIKVGHNILIRRAGRPISVHDLSGDDDIRVVGTRDGMDIKAARIDVLTPLAAPTLPAKADPAKPHRPGL